MSIIYQENCIDLYHCFFYQSSPVFASNYRNSAVLVELILYGFEIDYLEFDFLAVLCMTMPFYYFFLSYL